MIEVKIEGITKWQVNEYTFTDPQMGIRSISMTVKHPSMWTGGDAVPEVADFNGAYVEYNGETYSISSSKPTADKSNTSLDYIYTLIFKGEEDELTRRKVRDLALVSVDNYVSQGTIFSISATISQFANLIQNNLTHYFGNKWSVNLSALDSDTVQVDVNNMFLWDLLVKTYEYYGVRWNIRGNVINIGVDPEYIEHVFDYGAEGGLVKITRTAPDMSIVNRLSGMGGTRNVPMNYFTSRYSNFPPDPNTINDTVYIRNIMPKVFRDSVIAGSLPYKDYVEDLASIAVHGIREDALAPNEDIYPSIAGVTVSGLGRIDELVAAEVPEVSDPDDDLYLPTFDIWIKNIGFDLAEDQYTASEDAKIHFTTGELAGYEFVILAVNGVRKVEVDTTKSHDGVSSMYKVTLIKSDEELDASGKMLPNTAYKAQAGDNFVILNIEMPQVYVELAEQRVEDWLNAMLGELKVEKPTFTVEPMDMFFEDDAPESDGKTIGQKLKSGNKLSINNTKITDGVQELFINNVNIQYGGLLPKYTFTVTDKVQVQGSSVQRLQSSIDGIMARQNLTELEINSFLKEISRKYLRKDIPNSASGLITFLKGIIVKGDTKLEDVELDNLIANELARLKKGATFGEEFITGMIGGRGAKLAEDENGKSVLEIDKITAREEFIAPKITFNNIDVISGDQAATFAFGTIKNVDTEERTFELDLLEGELGTLKQNDICRGVFHNLAGGNVGSDSTDTNGFLSYSGFATSYFSPSQILINEAGQMKVKYFIQPGTTVHPINGMNFFAYGNFTDTDRQGMTYQNRLYTRRLKNQDTWDIVPTRNIAFQDGLLEGLTIGGMEMHGYGTFSENNYMTGANIQFTPSQLDELRGKSSFSVSLSSYERVVKIDEDGIHGMHDELNVVSGDLNVTTDGLNVITSVNNLSTRIQAFKGEDELLFAQSPEKGKYSVVISEHGCSAEVQGGILSIEEITNLDECYVDINVNCEGVAVFEKRFSVVIVRDGEDGEGGITVDLDDSMQSVACDSSGTVLAGLPLSTIFSMYYGATPLELDSLILNAIPGVTASANKTTGVITVTAITQAVSDVIRLQITGKATYEGIEYAKRATLTINKIKPGPAGENAVIYSLQPSINAIYKDKDGVADVANISCDIVKFDGAERTVLSYFPGGYVQRRIDEGYYYDYIPGTEIPVSGITRKIQFVLLKQYVNEPVDVETVYVISDGADGSSAPLLYLSVSSDVMTFDADNNPKPASQTITIEAKLQNVTGTAIFTALPYIGSTAQSSITLGGSGNTRTLKQNQWGANVDRVVITAVLGSLSDVKTVVKVKDGTNGEDGTTPVVNILVPSVTQIGKTMTGSYEPSSFIVYHRNDSGAAVAAYMAVWGSNNGSTWTQIGSTTNVSSRTVNVASYPYKYYTIRTYSTSSPTWATAYLLSVSVNVLQDGQDGGIGPRGAMPVYCGYFTSGTTYTYTNETRDIVLRDFGGQTFVFQVKVHGSSVTAAPSSSTGDANWEVANKYSFVAMDTALIDGANIAGFMFKNSKMVSRMGTLDGVEIDIKNVPSGRINDFIPYTSMDGNSGEIKGERVIANNIQNKIKTAYSNSPAEIAAILSNGHSINISPPEGASFPADYNWYTINLPDNKDLSGSILTIHAPMASIKRYRIKPGNANAVFYVDEPARVASELRVVNGVRDTIELKAVWDEFNNTLDWHVLSRVNYKIQNNQGDGTSIRVPSVFKPGDIIAMGDVSAGGTMSNLINRYDEYITCSVSSGRFSLLVPNSRYYLPGSSTLSNRYSNLDKLDLQVTPNTSTFMNSYVYKYYSSSYGIYFNIEFRTYNGSSATATAFKFILRAIDYVVNSKYLDYSV